MSGDMSLRAEFGAMEQGQADLTTQAGTIEEYRASLRAEAQKALGNFGGGIGSTEHNAAMAIVDQLVDEHVQATRQQGAGLTNATEDFRAAGHQMTRGLASGA